MSPTTTPPNYSEAQVTELTEYGTHDYDSAKFFAEKFDKSPQSVISKIKSLDLKYEKQAAPRKKAVQTTKAELVDLIGKMIDRDTNGLEKATRSALLYLVNGIQHLIPPVEEVAPPELPSPSE